ncbi:hypothetical protein F7725_004005 [Dissostichus mawsoni]|uniref:Uncharacterized protein n=1 Tax=Dissostichus mawsoni TaxID=36200 RepID=A0A7J5YEE9_DISMA|nr:hypothetical protein F7725_004005 [Dissostichus mawsoni]
MKYLRLHAEHLFLQVPARLLLLLLLLLQSALLLLQLTVPPAEVQLLTRLLLQQLLQNKRDPGHELLQLRLHLLPLVLRLGLVLLQKLHLAQQILVGRLLALLRLLQLLGQLLQDGAVSLPHLLDLTLVVLRFLLDVFLQLRHFLLALLSSVSSSSVFSASSSSLRSRFSFSALFRAIFSDSRSSCSSLSEACISRTFFRALFFWLTSPLSSSLLSPTWSASAAARPPSSPADLSAPLAESGAQRSGPGSRWFPRPASSSPSPAPDGSSPPSSVSLKFLAFSSSSASFEVISLTRELGVLVLQQQNVLLMFLHLGFSRHFLQLQFLPGGLLLMFTWMCDCIFFFSFTVLWLLSSPPPGGTPGRGGSPPAPASWRPNEISSPRPRQTAPISPSTLLCFSFTFTSSSSFACISSSCRVSAADGLEVDDDVGDLQVPLLLQVSQHSGSEEDFTLTDPEEVQVEL